MMKRMNKHVKKRHQYAPYCSSENSWEVLPALSAGSPLAVDPPSFNITGSTQERDPIHGLNVVKPSIGGHTLSRMRELAQPRVHMDVRKVEISSARWLILLSMSTRTREGPRECRECGKAFSPSSALIDPRRIHSGERPRKCKDCGRLFPQSTQLTRRQKFILEKNPTNVLSVRSPLLVSLSWLSIREFTLEREWEIGLRILYSYTNGLKRHRAESRLNRTKASEDS